MSTLWSALQIASSIAFIAFVPLVIWQTIEQRRLRRALQGMEAKEVVESARTVQRMSPALLSALHGVQQAWRQGGAG